MKTVFAVAAVLALLCLVGSQALAGTWTVADLNPSGSTGACGYGASGNLQAGYAYIGGNPNAGLWNGTAGSWVDLNPSGAGWSYAYRSHSVTQTNNKWFTFL